MELNICRSAAQMWPVVLGVSLALWNTWTVAPADRDLKSRLRQSACSYFDRDFESKQQTLVFLEFGVKAGCWCKCGASLVRMFGLQGKFTESY